MPTISETSVVTTAKNKRQYLTTVPSEYMRAVIAKKKRLRWIVLNRCSVVIPYDSSNRKDLARAERYTKEILTKEREIMELIEGEAKSK